MVDTSQLYKNFAHVNSLVHQTLPGGFGMGGGSRYQHAIQSWAVTGKSADDIWYSYYMVEIDSILFTSVDGTFKLNQYNYDCRLVDANGLIVPTTELVAVTPDTTQGSTSYTTSMSELFSASGGFFGADPTATIGGSVTFGHSVSRTSPTLASITGASPATGKTRPGRFRSRVRHPPSMPQWSSPHKCCSAFRPNPDRNPTMA